MDALPKEEEFLTAALDLFRTFGMGLPGSVR